MDRAPGLPATEGATSDTPDEAEGGAHAPTAGKKAKDTTPNLHTTLDGITSPKFGSAGSSGTELEPGPERD